VTQRISCELYRFEGNTIGIRCWARRIGAVVVVTHRRRPIFVHCVALIFGSVLRPETAGVYWDRAFERLAEVEHCQARGV
jgi:hypothetical protein